MAQLEATKSRLVCAPLTTEVALPRHVEAFRQWKARHFFHTSSKKFLQPTPDAAASARVHQFKAAWNAKQFDGACDAPPRPCPPPVPCVLASA